MSRGYRGHLESRIFTRLIAGTVSLTVLSISRGPEKVSSLSENCNIPVRFSGSGGEAAVVVMVIRQSHCVCAA